MTGGREGAAQQAAQPPQAKTVRVRLLSASHGRPAGAVVETSPDKAAKLIERGLARKA